MRENSRPVKTHAVQASEMAQEKIRGKEASKENGETDHNRKYFTFHVDGNETELDLGKNELYCLDVHAWLVSSRESTADNFFRPRVGLAIKCLPKEMLIYDQFASQVCDKIKCFGVKNDVYLIVIVSEK